MELKEIVENIDNANRWIDKKNTEREMVEAQKIELMAELKELGLSSVEEAQTFIDQAQEDGEKFLVAFDKMKDEVEEELSEFNS